MKIVAHRALQCLEIQTYLEAFFRDVQGLVRAQKAYAATAAYVNLHIDRVFEKVVLIFIGEVGDEQPAPALLGSALKQHKHPQGEWG